MKTTPVATISIACKTPGHCQLVGRLDHANVAGVLQQTQQLLNTNGELILDLAGVEHSDSAGLAMLTALLRYGHDQHKPIAFTHMPAQMKSMALLSGLDNALSLEQ